MESVPEDDLRRTRESLHTVVELVLAGPQHRASGTIRLRVDPGSLHTVAGPGLALTPSTLSGPGGEASLLAPATARELAAAVGVDVGAPEGLYGDHAALGPDDRLSVDVDAATALLEWFSVGAAAMLQFAPQEQAVLWPEHFDLAVTVDAATYGVSPGDGFSAQPYAYVLPPAPADDSFFDAPFGAARTWDLVPDAAGITAFFHEGRDRAATVRYAD